MKQLSGEDIVSIKDRGIDPENLNKQYYRFNKGFPPLNLVRPATPGNGIINIENKVQPLLALYEKMTQNASMVKFVPASGAATRMMNVLSGVFYGLKNNDINNSDVDNTAAYVLKNIKSFAFHLQLEKILKNNNFELDKLLKEHAFLPILEFLLTDKGLGYDKMPKALTPFHQYQDVVRTAMEEHLVEGALYCKKNNNVNIHFTITEAFKGEFEAFIKKVIAYYEKKYGIHYNIGFSFQDKATDMIAVELNNELVRNNDGSLLFRPGGHGALLSNLNALNEDVIFIKNIDNIVHERYIEPTVKYKQLLGGLLFDYKVRINAYISKLRSGSCDENILDEISAFIENDLCYFHNIQYTSKEQRAKGYLDILDRPLRVCGMVQSEGDTGGGPYWIKNSDGSTSLQIVETSQINMDDYNQSRIFQAGTHFNPTDIACSVKDADGNKYDLQKFIDSQTGIITKKNFQGRNIKVQEHPGLWNGSMAYWNTVFAEVPLITFNPVKSIEDLLKETHQPA